MKKLLFIMNPRAGTRRANRHLTEMLNIFTAGGYTCQVHITQKQGDGTEAVKAFGKEADLIVCCGGDGTFNETISGVQALQLDVPIGYIPAGSTNDLANSLQLSFNALTACRHILAGKPVKLDLGQFSDRYFSYIASFGAFTRASYATPQSVKNALGHTAYILGGIQEISQIRDTHVRLELDGEVIEGDFIFGAICNSTSVGGILTLDSQQVDMQDGKFEVLLVRAPKDLTEIAECIQAVQKQKYNCKMITFRSACNIRVETEEEMPWTLDGEREEGHRVVEIKNLPGAYTLMRKE